MALFLRADLSLPIPTPFIMVMAPALNTRASASIVDDPDLPFWQSRVEVLGTPHPLIALSPWISYSTLLSPRAYPTDPAWPSMARQRSRANARTISPFAFGMPSLSPLYGRLGCPSRPLDTICPPPPSTERVTSSAFESAKVCQSCKTGVGHGIRGVMECRYGLLKI